MISSSEIVARFKSEHRRPDSTGRFGARLHAPKRLFSIRDRLKGPIGACFALVFAAAVLFSMPASAFADARPTDEILSQPLSASGLAESLSPDIQAENALLVSKDGTVYFSRDSSEPVKIASITKVMTAIVALEHASLDVEVVVDEEAATVGESSAGLRKGDKLDLETALYALMIPSGNDAAIAIAKAVGALLPGYNGENSQELFVAEMNSKAAELGCSNTVYTNPHGLDADRFESDAHSTAADVGIVVSYAMKNDTFRSIVDAGDTTVFVKDADGVERPLNLVSTDELLGVYDGICGVKTGTTVEAGYCFAGAAARDEGEFYSVVLGSPSSDDRFADTAALFDWVYGNICENPLINVESTIPYRGEQFPLVARVSHADWTDRLIPATVEDPELSAEVFVLAGDIEQKVVFNTVTGDVSAGDTLGSIEFSQDGAVIATCDLVAASDVPAPGFLESIGVHIDRFIRGLQGQPQQAASVCLNAPSPILDF